MANKIISGAVENLYNSNPELAPSPSELGNGQIAVNTSENKPRIFIKKANGQLATFIDENAITGKINEGGSALSAHVSNQSNPHNVTKAQVGLGNVDNTSDANKPVSTAQASAIADAKKAGTDAQSNLTAHTSNTSNPHSVTKAQVGLGNVDNTSDLNKPISSATQGALDGKLGKSETAANSNKFGNKTPKEFLKTESFTSASFENLVPNSISEISSHGTGVLDGDLTGLGVEGTLVNFSPRASSDSNIASFQLVVPTNENKGIYYSSWYSGKDARRPFTKIWDTLNANRSDADWEAKILTHRSTLEGPKTRLAHNGIAGYLQFGDGSQKAGIISARSGEVLDSLIVESNSTKISRNLGVGVTASAQFHVVGTNRFEIPDTTAFRIKRTISNAGSFILYNPSNQEVVGYAVGCNQDNSFSWYAVSESTTYSGKMFLTYDGKLGIGVESPTYSLQVESEGSKQLLIKSNDWAGSMTCGLDFCCGKQKTVPTSRIDDLMVKDGSSGGTLRFHTQQKGSANPNTNGLTERMRITDTGDVGIGTTNPTHALHVERSSSSLSAIKIKNGVGTLLTGSDTDGSGFLWVETNTPLRLGTNNTEKVRLLPNGNLGIGSNNPTQKLHVVGNGLFEGNVVAQSDVIAMSDRSDVIITAAGAGFLYELGDVTISDAKKNDFLVYNGAPEDPRWVNMAADDLKLVTTDVSGKIPDKFLPDSILGQVHYEGTWNATNNTPDLTEVKPKGTYYVVIGSGSHFGKSWNEGDWIISNGTSWDKVDNTDSVQSVNGKTGVVTVTKADVGLGSVRDIAQLGQNETAVAANKIARTAMTYANSPYTYIENGQTISFTAENEGYAQSNTSGGLLFGSSNTACYLTVRSGTNNSEMYVRSWYADQFSSWYKLLHSGNYNEFAPSKTGSGASGDWGINITGNAATATNSSQLGGIAAGNYYHSGNSNRSDVNWTANNMIANTFTGTNMNLSGNALIGSHQVWHAGNSNLRTVDWVAKNLKAGNVSANEYSAIEHARNGFISRLCNDASTTKLLNIDNSDGSTKGGLLIGASSIAYTTNGSDSNTIWHSGNSNLPTVDWNGKTINADTALTTLNVRIFGNPLLGGVVQLGSSSQNAGSIVGNGGGNMSVLNVKTEKCNIVGNVAIGTSNASEKLQVNGNAIVSGNVKAGNFLVDSYQVWHAGNSNKSDVNWNANIIYGREIRATEVVSSTGTNFDVKAGTANGENQTGGDLYLWGGVSTGNAAGGFISFRTSPSGGAGSSTNNGVERMRIVSGGNIGIGTANPTTKLHVAGDIKSDANITSAGATIGEFVFQYGNELNNATGKGLYLNYRGSKPVQIGSDEETTRLFVKGNADISEAFSCVNAVVGDTLEVQGPAQFADFINGVKFIGDGVDVSNAEISQTTTTYDLVVRNNATVSGSTTIGGILKVGGDYLQLGSSSAGTADRPVNKSFGFKGHYHNNDYGRITMPEHSASHAYGELVFLLRTKEAGVENVEPVEFGRMDPDQFRYKGHIKADGDVIAMSDGSDVFDLLGAGGASSLFEMSDVEISDPLVGQTLVYDPKTKKWSNKAVEWTTLSGTPSEFNPTAHDHSAGSFSTSDARLKENVREIKNVSSYIEALNPVEYDWKDEAKERYGIDEEVGHGFIAQEVQEIIPSAVREIHGSHHLGIDYAKIVPFLVGTVKEMMEEIRELKQEIENLKSGK